MKTRSLIIALCLSLPLSALELTVVEGIGDAKGGTAFLDSSEVTLALNDPLHRWLWFVEITRPGTFTVSARATADASRLPASLSVGQWLPARGEGSSATTALAESGGTDWQTLGEIVIPSPGTVLLFARLGDAADFANPPLLHAIRLEGPGEIIPASSWEARTSACDPSTTGAGVSRGARYTEIIPEPGPARNGNGTFATCQAPGGYLGCQESFFWSSWESGGVFPEILEAFGGTRAYDHEGSGRTISLEDFSLPLDVRRETLVLFKDDPSGPLATVLVGEAGQPWHLLGRMRRPPGGTTVSGTLGFLENPGNFNGNLVTRSAGWANPWFYGKPGSQATGQWFQPAALNGMLRGPSPAGPAPLPRGTYPWGEVRMRQDLMEMTIGGQIEIASNSNSFPTPPATLPVLPALNLAYRLPDASSSILAPSATAQTLFTTSLADLIKDPHGAPSFSFTLEDGPAWLTLAGDGTLTGTPASADTGCHLLTVAAHEQASGLSGHFNVALFVNGPGNNAPAFLANPPLVQTTASPENPVVFAPRFHDPDVADSPVLTITAGNEAGLFAIDSTGNRLVKVATPPPGSTHTLSLAIADQGGLTDTLDVAVRTGEADQTGGLFRERWFTLEGGAVQDLVSSPHYPSEPNQKSLVGDLLCESAGKNTGSRLQGWLHPPTSGDYTFWATGDDQVEVRLSNNATRSSLALVCQSPSATGPLDYEKYSSQQSAPVSLQGGQRYFIEILHKRAGASGGTPGSYSLAWQGPGFERMVIPAGALSPLETLAPAFAADTFTLRPAIVGAEYLDGLHPKLATIALHPAIRYAKTSGPGWLNLAPDGTISGTPAPSDAGINTFALRATTPGGLFDEATFTIEVSANEAPVWRAIPVQGPVNEGASLDIPVSGFANDANLASIFGTGDQLSFALENAPEWLLIDSTGRLYGTPPPDSAGQHQFLIKATDLANQSAITAVTLVVNAVPDPPRWIPRGSRLAALPLTPFSIDLNPLVFDPDPGESLTFHLLSGPDWLKVDVSGILAGVPAISDIGVDTITVQVTDSTGGQASDEIIITVADPDPVVYEGFTGAAGIPVNGAGSGSGWLPGSSWSMSSDSAALGSANAFPGLVFSGLSAAMAGGADGGRALSRRFIVGDGAGEYSELWVAFSVDNPGPISIGHSFQVGLTDGGATTLLCGKSINGPWELVLGSRKSTLVSSTTNGNLGNWLNVLRFSYKDSNTEVAAFLAKEGDSGFEPLQTGTYPRSTALAWPGKLAFDGVRIESHNTNSARIDEIAVAGSLDRLLTMAVDTDNDGLPNHLDEDDDGDGYPDVWEAAHGLNPLAPDENQEPIPSVPSRNHSGIISPSGESGEIAVPITNLGNGLDLAIAATLGDEDGWSIPQPLMSVPASSTGLLRIEVPLSGGPGVRERLLTLETNSLTNPQIVVPVSYVLAPSGTPVATYDFDPDESQSSQLDSSDVSHPLATAGILIDRATGTGALGSGNQTLSNRTISPGNTGNRLLFSCARESDAGRPIGAPGETTWLTFTLAPAPGALLDLEGGFLFLETMAATTLVTTTSADWTLYYSTDDGLTWSALDTYSGAATSGTMVARKGLLWNLSPIGLASSPLTFAVDPVSSGLTNGVTAQRSIGLDNLIVTAGSLFPPGFQSWARSSGASTAPGFDSDGDGLPDLLEYALGMNPKEPGVSPALFDGTTVSFPKGIAASLSGDVRYSFETSSDLGRDDPWQKAGTGTTESSESISYQFPLHHARLFCRLRVELAED